MDRWEHHPDQAPGQDVVYWHILMHQHPEAVELARHTQQRLAAFDGFHMTPLEWLHITTLVAGPRERFTDEQLQEMLRLTSQHLAKVEPITVTLGKVFYHPQAIVLTVEPQRALDPVRQAVQVATREVTSLERPEWASARWAPHATLGYSTSRQPTAPIIAQLGRHLPHRDIAISAVSLVVQRGPERMWDWRTVGTVRFGELTSGDVRSPAHARSHRRQHQHGSGKA